MSKQEVHNMFDHIEGIGGIIEYYGYPDFVINNKPLWMTGEVNGLILHKNGQLSPFYVCMEDRIFDVWTTEAHDGYFVDYGEEYFNEFIGQQFNNVILGEPSMLSTYVSKNKQKIKEYLLSMLIAFFVPSLVVLIAGGIVSFIAMDFSKMVEAFMSPVFWRISVLAALLGPIGKFAFKNVEIV